MMQKQGEAARQDATQSRFQNENDSVNTAGDVGCALEQPDMLHLSEERWGAAPECRVS